MFVTGAIGQDGEHTLWSQVAIPIDWGVFIMLHAVATGVKNKNQQICCSEL